MSGERSIPEVTPAGVPELDARLLDAVHAWLAVDPDPSTRAELEALVGDGDAVELADRFAGRLTFGTSGIRGRVGAGPNRMNRLVVRQVAAGLAMWLPPGSLVVVGCDARTGSADFAEDAARVLAGAGHRVVQLDDAVPTPVLAFAVLQLGADAGVMVTASHNPAPDNGLKIYGADGAQLVSPADVEVVAAVERAVGGPAPRLAAPDDPRLERAGEAIVAAYVDAARRIVGSPASDIRIVYSPLHGVGAATTTAVFAAAGFGGLVVVPEQEHPDAAFPTTSFPNPEEPGALDLALRLARATDADLVLANDPDADRLGVAVPGRIAGTWQLLTGDEVGALFADHLLAQSAHLGADRLVVSTIVSSSLVQRIADAHGVHHVETLTGFKWIVRPALQHPEWRMVFAYEESLGYAVSPMVHDKDGITAALVMAEISAKAVADGTTLLARLDDLACRYGLHATLRWSVRDDDPGGADRLRSVMDRVRRDPPVEFDGRVVTGVVDYATGRDGLPPTDTLRLDLADGSRVMLRPSGTEPKLKVYLATTVPARQGAVNVARDTANASLEALLGGVQTALGFAPTAR